MKFNLSLILKDIPILNKSINYICYLLFKLVRILSFPQENNSGKILVISFCRIGDTVFTIPALKIFSKIYKDITIVCYDNSKTIYQLIFSKFKYIVVNDSGLKFGRRIVKGRYRKIIKEINPQKIFDLTGTILSASLIFNSHTKKIIGFNDNYFKALYSDFIPKRTTPHLIDLYLDPVSVEHEINEAEIEREYKVSFDESRKILIHPFAGWEAKEWGINKFIKLTELLRADYDCAFIFSNVKTDRQLFNKLAENNIKFIATNSLKELIEEIKEASLMISNDSGPIYLANILGKSTFTIYGPTNPEYSLPFGNFHRFIQKKISCSPKKNKQYCFTNAGRNCPNYECMNKLEVNEVYDGVIELLKDLEITKNAHKV